MSRILPAGAVLLAATFIALGVAPGASYRPASAANASVSIADFAFSPGTVTVSVGDTVTWTNNDGGVPHTVSSDSGSELASGQLAGGASYQKTFSAAGSYAYHCDIHPSMTGLVVVTGAAATATATLAATTTPTATTAAATATATLAATNTPTATTAAATATSPAAATNTPTAAGGTTPTAAVSPTSAPQPPATGDGDAGDDDTATAVTSGIVAIVIVLAVGAAVYMVRRRGQSTT